MHRQHNKPIERKLLCIFPIFFFGNAPTTSRQGTLPFYKNKNPGNLCQNLKSYILTYQVISNKFTIVRLSHVELAIDFKIKLNILGVLWNGLKRRVVSSYQLWSLRKV
jgi:hypothetical protein